MKKKRMINQILGGLIFSFLVLSVGSLPAEDEKPLTPQEALSRITVPEGFHVSLFAGEPDVVQPIAFCFDDRGRLWVVECYSYPEWSDKKQDRVLIFEDSNGDGRYDKRKVFFDEGVNLSGIEYGFGGIWLCSVPNLIFIPDANRDDVPDGPGKVILDGWDLKARHNVFNGLTWGPDGWLYGLNGILSNSRVGKPGTPDEKRIGIDCGVWRYHPVKDRFEAFAHGTTNPWGLDFDEYGQLFITNCVIHHLWHVPPGSHFQRMFGNDLNPHTYQLLESIADHIHWGGGNWTSSRVGIEKHDSAGGGHAHAGAMIYLGDNWPGEYRNGLYTLNIHGRRINHDLLEMHGSSYIARHGNDLFFANDSWFRGLELKYGPDGGVYITDWNDTGECHDYVNTQKGTGRIYKVIYKEVVNSPFDLAEKSDEELVELLDHPNEWYVTRARRILQERAFTGKLDPEIRDQLWKKFEESEDVKKQLKYLWSLHVTGEFTGKETVKLLKHPVHHVRGWMVRLCTEDGSVLDTILAELARMTKEDPHSFVRLSLASALQWLPVDQQWDIASELVLHEEDKDGFYLPLMYWYGIEKLVGAKPVQGIELLKRSRIPLLQKLIVRRLSKEKQIYDYLSVTNNEEMKLQILRGLHEAFYGQKSVNIPVPKETVFANVKNSTSTEAQLLIRLMQLQFGVKTAADELRELVTDTSQPVENREQSLQALIQIQDPKLVPQLLKLIDEKELALTALNGLASYSAPEIPGVLLGRYEKMSSAEKQAAISTLCSRPEFALALLNSVEKKEIPGTDLSTYSVRQLLALNHADLTKKIEAVWGKSRQSSEEKVNRMKKLKGLLTADALTNGDQTKGRAVFKKVCASCHRMFGEGGKIGPELTGSQRKNIDYVVQNLVDPNALVGKEYQMSLIRTEDGRTLSGIVVSENEKTVTVQTQTDEVILSVDEIEERKKQDLSMMPEGMLDRLQTEEIVNLVSYLQADSQVPLPEGAESQ